jgi:hypothetical protein
MQAQTMGTEAMEPAPAGVCAVRSRDGNAVRFGAVPTLTTCPRSSASERVLRYGRQGDGPGHGRTDVYLPSAG